MQFFDAISRVFILVKFLYNFLQLFGVKFKIYFDTFWEGDVIIEDYSDILIQRHTCNLYFGTFQKMPHIKTRFLFQ